MIRKFASYFLAFTLLLTSCNQEFSQESKSFEKYLETKFDQNFRADLHYYLIVSQIRCNSCVIKTLDEIAKRVDDSNSDSFTILTNDSLLIPGEMRNKVNLLYDPYAEYEQTNISLANLTIVKTNNSQIQKIKVVNLDEIHDVVNREFGSLN